MRILVVEDESTLRAQLVERLRAEGFAVDQAADGEEGLYFGCEYPLDLAIIDLGLPKVSGIDLIRRIRERGREYPILILTARSRWQEKVEGLEAGADDYMVKPFHVEEMLARLRALLRRVAGSADATLSCGPVQLDTTSQVVTVSGAQAGSESATASTRELDLTAYEYRLLHYLMMNVGKVISKAELTEHIYEEDADRDSNVIEVFIGRLRKKIDPDNSLKPIETLRGRGYRLNNLEISQTA